MEWTLHGHITPFPCSSPLCRDTHLIVPWRCRSGALPRRRRRVAVQPGGDPALRELPDAGRRHPLPRGLHRAQASPGAYPEHLRLREGPRVPEAARPPGAAPRGPHRSELGARVLRQGMGPQLPAAGHHRVPLLAGDPSCACKMMTSSSGAFPLPITVLPACCLLLAGPAVLPGGTRSSIRLEQQ